MDLELADQIRELAYQWDERLRREFGVGAKFTDWHSDELRALLAEPKFKPRVVGVKRVGNEWLPVVEL